MYKDAVPGLYDHCHKITHEIAPFQHCVNAFMQYHGASKQTLAVYKKYDVFVKNIHNYPTLPSLAFAIFRSNFIHENTIPQLSGKI